MGSTLVKRAQMFLVLASLQLLPRVASAQPQEGDAYSEALPVIPNRLTQPPLSAIKPIKSKDDWTGRAVRGRDGRYHLPSHGQPVLTLDPRLHDGLNKILRDYGTPYGAVVALEPDTGRILAMAEHSEDRPELRGLCTRAAFPAASIFKIVTAAALLDAGVGPEDRACSHGGARALTEKLLKDSARDRQCYSLNQAMGKSANVVFAKLTHKYLSADSLRRLAGAFRFNRPIEFNLPIEVSLAAIPEDPFRLASTGAGFGDVYLSPLHGAMVASVVATGGLWRGPVLLEGSRVLPPTRAISGASARALSRMMEETVTAGTARRIFRQRGYAVRDAAGKTGTLADRKPFRDYSWFVGFAPKSHPRIAVAAVVVNGPRWKIRATYLGREAMRLYALVQAGIPSAAEPAPAPASEPDEPEEKGEGEEAPALEE